MRFCGLDRIGFMVLLVVTALGVAGACSSKPSSPSSIAQDTAEETSSPDVGTSDDLGGVEAVGSDVQQFDDYAEVSQVDDVAADAPAIDEWAYCDAMKETDCLEIVRGESVFYQRISKHQTMEFDDKGVPRTVVRLSDLIELEITDVPEGSRYQIFGMDGFTFGGFATWDQMMQGYMEVGTRRVVWEPALELPDSWRVKDSYRIEMSPAGG